MGYRETFFRNTPSVMGKYQCACCGRWFTKKYIDVDHRISKRHGGTDALWNLQAMCRHCNRSKRERTSNEEVAQTVITGAVSGLVNDGVGGTIDNMKQLGKSVLTQKIKDLLGIKYMR